MEAALNCPVCLEHVKGTALVPSMHTVCGICAAEHYTGENDQVKAGVKCPVCQAVAMEIV
jgi:hypothetical protein